ncbi:MAG: SPOR domain-containing protein [Terrimonas sp.]|nr:SPOR domain-containing protein [Terrimonas sp.]
MPDSGSVVVHKDPRLDMLIKKQVQINEETTRNARRNVKGYRLLVVITNNRDEALAAKSKLYNYFPELKSYLVWSSPNFQIRAGNFKEREDADEYRKKMNAYFPKGVFIMKDLIEVKLDIPSEDSEQ